MSVEIEALINETLWRIDFWLLGIFFAIIFSTIVRFWQSYFQNQKLIELLEEISENLVSKGRPDK
jgi:hypothetical protein